MDAKEREAIFKAIDLLEDGLFDSDPESSFRLVKKAKETLEVLVQS